MVTDNVSQGVVHSDRGRFFEDFSLGDVFQHWPGRTLSEADNTWFTLLTMNTHPIHFDANYAAQTEFGKPIICSPLTLAVIVGMSVRDVSQNALANLGWSEIRMTAPMFAGDTLYAGSTVIALRASVSRSEQGLVSVRTEGRNQNGVIVCDFERTMLLWKRGFGPAGA